MERFANRLREARIAAGLTQEQLGFSVDVTKASVSAWENDRETPSFRVLELLPQTLGCSLDHLVCGAGRVSEGQTAYHADHRYARDSSEEALLLRFRKMTAARRKALLELIQPAPDNKKPA